MLYTNGIHVQWSTVVVAKSTTKSEQSRERQQQTLDRIKLREQQRLDRMKLRE
jgi:hypothetical protein